MTNKLYAINMVTHGDFDVPQNDIIAVLPKELTKDERDETLDQINEAYKQISSEMPHDEILFAPTYSLTELIPGVKILTSLLGEDDEVTFEIAELAYMGSF